MTPKIEFGLNISENFFDPMDFVDAAVYADEAGLATAWFGDHFVPWFHSANKSGFVWPYTGGRLERTSRIKVGPLVSTPIGARSPPAIIAQASATVDNMYPGRFVLAIGSGEALNEAPFWNGRWPKWGERMERLTEGTTLMRRLWESSEPFKFEGKYFSSDFYFLYTKPKTRIPVCFSAIGKRGAYYAGLHGDNLLTIAPRVSRDRLKDELLPAYRKGCTDAGRKEGQVILLLFHSFLEPDEFRKRYENTLGVMLNEAWGFKDPVVAEAKGKEVSLERMKENVSFCDGWKGLVKVIEDYREVGAGNFILDYDGDRKTIKDYSQNLLNLF